MVVDEKAKLYRIAKNTGVTGDTLSAKTIVVIYPENQSDGFVEFSAYDPVNSVYRNNLFIKADSLSSRETDVQSSILLQTALALDTKQEANRRAALLEAAFSDYPDSAFASEIRGLVNPGSDNVIAVQPSSFLSAIINDDNVNVREQPSTSAPVKDHLFLGTSVTIDKETVEADNIDGGAYQWFHITEPQEGWVFGAFLE